MIWRRTTDEEINRMGNSWTMFKELLRNTVIWQNFTEALCSIQELQDSSSSSSSNCHFIHHKSHNN
jgi:hypothetical protein